MISYTDKQLEKILNECEATYKKALEFLTKSFNKIENITIREISTNSNNTAISNLSKMLIDMNKALTIKYDKYYDIVDKYDFLEAPEVVKRIEEINNKIYEINDSIDDLRDLLEELLDKSDKLTKVNNFINSNNTINI